MSRPVLKAIVAMASNRVIGREGTLPWRIPADLKWFKKLTLGHPIVMGRRTMESLKRPLLNRRNIVVSRACDDVPDGFELVRSCEDAVDLLAEEETVFVIGGGQIYAEMLPWCDEVYVSYVFHPYPGDTWLLEFESGFQMCEVLYRDEDFELRRYASREKKA